VNTSPTPSTTKYLMDVAKLNAQLNDDYAAWRAGSFRIYVLRPQTMEALKKATADQLTRRQIFIAQLRGRAYKTEWHNIKRILQEREKLAKEMLDAAQAQTERVVEYLCSDCGAPAANTLNNRDYCNRHWSALMETYTPLERDHILDRVEAELAKPDFRLIDRVDAAIAYGQVAEMVNEVHEVEA
jgi:hypothetical protein